MKIQQSVKYILTALMFTDKRKTSANICYPSSAAQWFSVCIFPLGQLIGLTGNRPKSATTPSGKTLSSIVKKT